MEQENRRLELNGGIIGITQNKSQLTRIVDDFERIFGINDECTRKEHLEITGNKICRITQNKEKLEQVLEHHGNPFCSTSEDLCNIVTSAVLADSASDEITETRRNWSKCFRRIRQQSFN